jgi:hypothetical protein
MNELKAQSAVGSSELLCELELALDHANNAAEYFRKTNSPRWYGMLPILESLRDMTKECEIRAHNAKPTNRASET